MGEAAKLVSILRDTPYKELLLLKSSRMPPGAKVYKFSTRLKENGEQKEALNIVSAEEEEENGSSCGAEVQDIKETVKIKDNALP
ncbi:hypothetical protein OUZ56_023012 [Daphnia magna]|uniref:Uncharacterized protein n=1 Tax=Daphnia magna TaxID=35525 RepID=A0ABR0AY46_9CRUS|nr:hypothetical protein OUZ56_023012 [Daphnia magna]